MCEEAVAAFTISPSFRSKSDYEPKSHLVICLYICSLEKRSVSDTPNEWRTTTTPSIGRCRRQITAIESWAPAMRAHEILREKEHSIAKIFWLAKRSTRGARGAEHHADSGASRDGRRRQLRQENSCERCGAKVEELPAFAAFMRSLTAMCFNEYPTA